MSKTSTPKRKSRPTDGQPSAAKEHVAHVMRIQPTRETVESVAVAVVLAFLFRSFVAEAFVIPTGSMAPTLQGQHIDVECPECGYQYRANASGEARDNRFVVESVCPNCRFHLELDREGNRNHRSFTGDRILVSKFAYELGDPQRWDVIVFKFPGNAKQNYIKRLIGLPNELIRIQHGDIHVARRLFTMNAQDHEPLTEGKISELIRGQFEAAGHALSPDATVMAYPSDELPGSHLSQSISKAWQIVDSERDAAYEVRLRRAVSGEMVTEFFTPFEIARKPADKARPLLHLVYDTQHQSRTLKKVGWPARWRSRSGDWKSLDEGGYATTGEGESVMRYRHAFPTEDDWLNIVNTGEMPPSYNEGQLITDHYAYNDFMDASPYSSPLYEELDKQGANWVGDLAVETEVTVSGDKGTIVLDLVEGGVHFTCEIDVADGKATLHRSDDQAFGTGDNVSQRPIAKTRVDGKGTYRLRLANVDDELRLWVDGALIEFDVPTTYAARTEVSPRWSTSDPGDYEPVGIGTRDLKAVFHQTQVFRDIYYVAINDSSSQQGETSSRWTLGEVFDFYRSPERWKLREDFFQSRNRVEFFIEDDCFMPLGDNSPASSDARMWDKVRGAIYLDDDLGYHAYPYFERDYLIGKAILIYWPHGWRTGIKFLPIPNVKRMGLIR